MKRAIRIAAFPVIWSVAIGGVYLALRAGINTTLATVGAGTFTLIAVAILELVLPFRRAWRPRWRDLRVDGISLGVLTWIVPAVAYWLHPVLVAITADLASSMSAWPASWPFVVQVLMALLVSQFLSYWWHRAHHAVPLLWRFHAFHHSADRLYVVNASRTHPLEDLGGQLLVSLAMLALGAPGDVLIVTSVALAGFGTFQHSNTDLAWGPLDLIFVSNRIHRWHHSALADEANHNYGSCVLLWDRVFRTYKAFEGDAPAALGTGGSVAFPEGYLAQVVAPIAWTPGYETSRR